MDEDIADLAFRIIRDIQREAHTRLWLLRFEWIPDHGAKEAVGRAMAGVAAGLLVSAVGADRTQEIMAKAARHPIDPSS